MANETATKSRRDKGDGTIFKNSKGKWIARYNKKGMPSKEFSGNTKTEVKAKLEEYKFLVQSGEVINLKFSVEQYAIKFLHHKNKQVLRKTLKQTTYDCLESTFERHIKSHPISKTLMRNLESSNIQMLIDEIQPNYSFSTIKKVYLFFHSMVKHGITEKDFPKNYVQIQVIFQQLAIYRKLLTESYENASYHTMVSTHFVILLQQDF